jgi:uncharacterized damage-inducible protein DinB/heme-degrading monooxygenase HmoA
MEEKMITRVWYGWTKPENAEGYESLLRNEIFPGVEARGIEGYRGIELLRREAGDEVEFVTSMRFESMAAVRAFAGEEYETAVVPQKARALLARFDQQSRHYETDSPRPETSSEAMGLLNEMKRAWLGDAWYGPALHEALAGVTAEKAAIRIDDATHTIWEIVEHIAAWENTCLRRLGGESLDSPEEGDFPSTTDISEKAWAQTLARAEEIHQRFLNAYAEQTPTTLEQTMAGKQYSVRYMLYGALNHLVYHTGQIVLLKKLIA